MSDDEIKIEALDEENEEEKLEEESLDGNDTVEDEEIEIVDEEPEEDDVEIFDEDEEEEEGYRVRRKPELSKDDITALHLRDNKNRARPKFRRQEWFRYKRLGDSWRKARGMHSKTRMNWRYRPDKPSIGFRGPRSVRGKHSSGFEDILIHNVKDLEILDPKKQAARIAHTVGTRKRVAIEKRARELEIRILNWGT